MIINSVLLLSILFLALLVFLWWKNHQKRQDLGILTAKQLYQDNPNKPGVSLYSKNLPLSGKPDYIVEYQKTIIPIEIKTGKTPSLPYKSHVMQLTAYCLLIEENYHKRPPYGLIKYPENEFIVEFTKDNEQELYQVINQIYEYKTHRDNFEIDVHSPKICKKCRLEMAGQLRRVGLV